MQCLNLNLICISVPLLSLSVEGVTMCLSLSANIKCMGRCSLRLSMNNSQDKPVKMTPHETIPRPNNCGICSVLQLLLWRPQCTFVFLRFGDCLLYTSDAADETSTV